MKQSVRKPSVLCICDIAQDEHNGNFVLGNYYRENRMAFLLTYIYQQPWRHPHLTRVQTVNHKWIKLEKFWSMGLFFFTEKRSCDFMLEGQNKAIYKNVRVGTPSPGWAVMGFATQCFLGLFVWTNGSRDAKNSSPFWEKTRYLNSLTLEGINCRREKCELERFVNVAGSNPGISC